MRGIKNVLEDVKWKMLTHQTFNDYSHYEHLKTDLLNEIHQCLSILLNSHAVACLRLMGIYGYHLDPNSYRGDRTNFSLAIVESELIHFDVIHGGPDALQVGANREL